MLHSLFKLGSAAQPAKSVKPGRDAAKTANCVKRGSLANDSIPSLLRLIRQTPPQEGSRNTRGPHVHYLGRSTLTHATAAMRTFTLLSQQLQIRKNQQAPLLSREFAQAALHRLRSQPSLQQPRAALNSLHPSMLFRAGSSDQWNLRVVNGVWAHARHARAERRPVLHSLAQRPSSGA